VMTFLGERDRTAPTAYSPITPGAEHSFSRRLSCRAAPRQA
jgi:hypothetical protein